MRTKLKAVSSLAEKSSHSVTEDLHKAFEGDELSERLYRYIRQEQNGLMRRKLKKTSLRLVDVDDIQQLTAMRASQAIKKKKYNSRESFTFLCITIIQEVLVDWLRYELAKKRRPLGQRVSEDVLLHLADDGDFQPGEREIAQELIQLVNQLLDEESSQRQEILREWMYEEALPELQKTGGSSKSKRPICSPRTRLRWIQEFRCRIYNAWLKGFEERRTELVKPSVEVRAETTCNKESSGRRKKVRPR